MICAFSLHLSPLSLSCRSQTEEAAQAARTELEFVEHVQTVPQKMVGWIVGSGGQSIREIEEKSGVLALNIGAFPLASVREY